MLRRVLRASLSAASAIGLAEPEGQRDGATRSRLRHLAVADVFEAEVPDKSSPILDIGCGRGALSAELHSRGYDNLFGCDWLEGDAVSARPDCLQYQRIDLNRAGLTAYASGIFDAVVCSDVIEHLESPARALSEIARVLRPAGKAIVSIPNAFNVVERLSWLLTGNSTRYKRESNPADFGHISVLPHDVLQSLAARAGLWIKERSGGYIYLDGYFVLPRWKHSLIFSYNEVLTLVKT
ncbi:MAG TPA: methyltransferase domain-containing protein [Sphingomicrobium sp.]|nr:methyltransferase domain-containing protein [Sphingomicrobium sp.]